MLLLEESEWQYLDLGLAEQKNRIKYSESLDIL